MSKKILKNRGQAIFEYIFLTAIVVIMAIGILRKIQGHMIADGPCPNDSIRCQMERMIVQGGFLDNNFERFRLYR